jgi:preprotein translocase subunit YajC
MNLLFIILMQGDPKGGGSSLMTFLPLVLIIVVFYFFMIRPQMRKQKEMKNFREGLKNGDKVITTGGIYGKIVEVRDQAVIIEVEDKMRLKIDKAAVVGDPTDAGEKK